MYRIPIKNTSSYKTRLLREILHYSIRELGIERWQVRKARFIGSRTKTGISGRAYWWGSQAGRIVLSISRRQQMGWFPMKHRGEIPLLDPLEELVYVIAHEVAHIAQDYFKWASGEVRARRTGQAPQPESSAFNFAILFS